MNEIKAVILDFDGVLVESNTEKTEAFKELFTLYPEHEEEMLAYHFQNFSVSRMRKFEHFVHDFMKRPDDTETVTEMAARFSDLVTKRVIACPEVPGAMSFLQRFSKRFPIYISSATPQSELIEIIHRRGMTSYLTGIFGDPPVKKREAIRSVLKREKVFPEETLFIGDALSDYHVARETGIRFMGRDSGLPFGEEDVPLYRDLFEISDAIRQQHVEHCHDTNG